MCKIQELLTKKELLTATPQQQQNKRKKQQNICRAYVIGQRELPLDLEKICGYKDVYTIKQEHTNRSLRLARKNPIALAQTKSSSVLENPEDPLPFLSANAWVADALITDMPKVPLLIRTADCLSIYILLEAENNAHPTQIALIHAGWRGLQQRIVYHCLHRMLQIFPRSSQSPQSLGASRVTIGFGPHARSCCYQVGAEFANWFAAPHLSSTGSGLYLNQMSLARSQIEEALSFGLGQAQREKSLLQYENSVPECTMCNGPDEENFYSYRRSQEQKNAQRRAQLYGRNLHVFVLEE